MKVFHVHFTLNPQDEEERAIIEALNAIPRGARKKVICAALSAHFKGANQAELDWVKLKAVVSRALEETLAKYNVQAASPSSSSEVAKRVLDKILDNMAEEMVL